MIKKPDIVSLKWVIGLLNKQADTAESALVAYGKDPTQKQALLRCMWSVHQITSTLRALGMRKAEMLTMEMERSLNYLYKDKIVGERGKLAMGGLMQGLKVIPAYLEHTENVRVDTGRGLERYVNDLRRWAGERPRPAAFFFYMDIPADAGITTGQSCASDEEIKSRANVMLALYLEMAKQALRKNNVAESMKTVARIAKKMQTLFAGTEAERFWFTMIGLCEGVAGGLVRPDECIAQIFKAGAFVIKFARENGSEIDASIDYGSYVQQMLYYVASCKSRPVHITSIRLAFGIGEETVSEAKRGLVHSDALVTALNGALQKLDIAVDFLSKNDLAALAKKDSEDQDASPLEAIEAAEYRLIAAAEMGHADTLMKVQRKLKQFYGASATIAPDKVSRVRDEITSGLVSVKQHVEHKLEHGLNSSYAAKGFKLRESVATATFRQMGLVEDQLHQILRRKALKNALAKRPLDSVSVLHLTTALQRHLNQIDGGHEELRQAILDADNGEADLDLLYTRAEEFQAQLKPLSERETVTKSLELLQQIADALLFSNMEPEGQVMQQCHKWLAASSDAGSVHEDDAFRCFADAFAQIEMHLQRSLIDPLDDTSHILALAARRAVELDGWIAKLPPGRAIDEAVADAVEEAAVDTVENGQAPQTAAIQDTDMPAEFREVFIEESEEIVAELVQLTEAWLKDPECSDVLRDIRRHFHTFKGNGRAVGANLLGELGWAAQDMLDQSLDGALFPGESVQKLVTEVVEALPALVESYSKSEGLDVERIRQLTSACFAMASSGAHEQAPVATQINKVISASG